MRNEKNDRVIHYIESVFVNESPILTEIRAQAEDRHRLGMQVSPYEGQILKVLSKMVQAKKVVEIGTFLGYSTMHFAEVAERVIAIEKDADVAMQAKSNFEKSDFADRIDLLVGEANEILSQIENQGPFDVVFIDANKAGYMDYLLWAEKNLRSGGLVIGDNSLLFGAVLESEKPEQVSQSQWESMRNFNLHLSSSPLWESVMIPTAEGLTIGVKN